MNPLDDSGFVLRHDPKDMFGLTVDYPNQCRRALEIARGVSFPDWSGIQSVVLSGLGGSAAGGDFLRRLFEAEGSVPMSVNRDYHLPKFVGPSTLVICSSYSGNTEETLSAYADAKAQGARILCLTSGGKLAELARADGFPVIQIPAGQPPRTALGYMLIPAIHACVAMGLLPEQDFEAAFALLDRCAHDWSTEPYTENQAKSLAQALHGRFPILYGLGEVPFAAANRWKGQINENAKVMCAIHAFPELNHNEILGWVLAETQDVRWSVILLEEGIESEKMKARARVTFDLISDKAEIHRFQAPGEMLLQRMLAMVYFGDFLSLYMAALNCVDPENIDWINVLKAELSRVD